MTESNTLVPDGRVGVLALIARRASEPAFWAIQGMVLGVSLLHVALEGGWISVSEPASGTGLHHLPVVLYLVPVAFASIRYGLEGGVLTSVWAGLLASINVLLFSLDDYEWVVDLGFVVLVVGVGIITALPVERERQQRHRAEAAARRLEALNEFAAISLPARTPAGAAKAVLDHMVSIFDLEDAGFALWKRGQSVPVVRAAYRSPSRFEDLTGAPSGGSSRSVSTAQDVESAEVESGELEGVIAVASNAPSTDPELASFLTAVGNQLATRVENALLAQQEQAAWATYVRLVTEAQEEERKRLARELHDGPAQGLAMLVRTLEDHPGLHDDAAAILTELRRVARDQRPTLLDDLGVVPALEGLVAEEMERSDLEIDLSVQGEVSRLEPETEIALYRIAQEAVRNALVHADSSRVEVALRFRVDEVELVVADDGSGFEVPEIPGGYLAAGRLGLMGMNERAQLVGGSLFIRSDRDSGTSVLARVPKEPGLADAQT